MCYFVWVRSPWVQTWSLAPLKPNPHDNCLNELKLSTDHLKMAVWVVLMLGECSPNSVKPLYTPWAWAIEASGVILMQINVLILTLGWLAFTLGLIITIMAFFYDLTVDGAGYRGVFLISMGIVILAVQNRRNRKPRNRIKARSP